MPVAKPLDRIEGEIKRRSEVVGIFSIDAAIARISGAILLEQNDSDSSGAPAAWKQASPSIIRSPARASRSGDRDGLAQRHRVRGHDRIPSAPSAPGCHSGDARRTRRARPQTGMQGRPR
jgi:hypothetical protein